MPPAFKRSIFTKNTVDRQPQAEYHSFSWQSDKIPLHNSATSREADDSSVLSWGRVVLACIPSTDTQQHVDSRRMIELEKAKKIQFPAKLPSLYSIPVLRDTSSDRHEKQIILP